MTVESKKLLPNCFTAAAEELDLNPAVGLISEYRRHLRKVLYEKLTHSAEQYDIELVDIQVKRIDAPDNVSRSVFCEIMDSATELRV